MRNELGQPKGKEYKQTFVPASKPESKSMIKNDAFTMMENDYNLTRKAAVEDHIQNKGKFLHGEFVTTAAFDNNAGPDWTKKTHKERLTGTL